MPLVHVRGRAEFVFECAEQAVLVEPGERAR